MINNEEEKVEKPIIREEKIPIQSHIERVEQPLGQNKVSEFSIKKHLEHQDKEEEKTQEMDKNLPADDFSNDLLQREWNKFLQKLAVDNIVIFSAINAFELRKIGANEIEVSYSSDTAKKEFESIENEFFNAFRKLANNFQIEVSYRKNETLKREILTKRKIFEIMLETNPLLKDLENVMKFDFN